MTNLIIHSLQKRLRKFLWTIGKGLKIIAGRHSTLWSRDIQSYITIHTTIKIITSKSVSRVFVCLQMNQQ